VKSDAGEQNEHEQAREQAGQAKSSEQASSNQQSSSRNNREQTQCCKRGRTLTTALETNELLRWRANGKRWNFASAEI